MIRKIPPTHTLQWRWQWWWLSLPIDLLSVSIYMVFIYLFTYLFIYKLYLNSLGGHGWHKNCLCYALEYTIDAPCNYTDISCWKYNRWTGYISRLLWVVECDIHLSWYIIIIVLTPLFVKPCISNHVGWYGQPTQWLVVNQNIGILCMDNVHFMGCE